MSVNFSLHLDHRGWQMLRDIRNPPLEYSVYRFVDGSMEGDVNVWLSPLKGRDKTFFFDEGALDCFGGVGCTVEDIDFHLENDEMIVLEEPTARQYLQALSDYFSRCENDIGYSPAHIAAVTTLMTRFPPRREA